MTQTPAAPETAGAAAAPRRRWRPLLIGVAALLVVVVGAVAVYAYTLNNAVSKNIHRGVDLPSEGPSSSASAPQITGTLNYVLLGSDSRNPTNAADGRSDSIMVVHLNQTRTKAYVISFPRDMYVEIPGHGRNKINEAYTLGGPALTVKTLENLTGVKMDHVALIDFKGFVQLTTDLGGVTVYNKHAFSKAGYNYPVGKVKLKGKKALWFVRERHQLPRGDLDRAENQRIVLKAIVDKGLSPAVIADPAKFTTFLANVAKHLTVDNTLTDEEIRQTALSLRLTGRDITLLQAPLSGFSNKAGAGSVDVVDEAKLAEMNKALKDDTMAEYVKNNQS